MSYQFPEIVLLNYPFADISSTKKRPALILLNGTYNDLVIARISSQEAYSEFDVKIEDYQECGLIKPSKIQIDKIHTINETGVFGMIGSLLAKDQKSFIEKFNKTYKYLEHKNS